ncbi:MAG: redoxin domain-containing protein, partial [Gammaproteobacteria bacterium]
MSSRYHNAQDDKMIPDPIRGSQMFQATIRISGALFLFFGLLISNAALSDSPAAGSPAPDIRLQDQNGDWHTLKQYSGQWVALYFYP